jgi:hypothetical protein
LRIGRIEGLRSARLERRLSFFGIDVGNERWLAKQRVSQRQTHHADAAEADQQDRPALGMRGQPLKRAVGR